MFRLGTCYITAVIGLLALRGFVCAEETKLKPEEFISKAMEWNACEKNLAQTAEKNASNEEVRKFAQHLAEDHAKCEKEIGEVIKARKIAVASVPNKEERDKVAEISKLKGVEFDRQFLARVIDSHERALKWFDQAAKTAADEQCRSCAERAAAGVRKHLEEARDLCKKLNF